MATTEYKNLAEQAGLRAAEQGVTTAQASKEFTKWYKFMGFDVPYQSKAERDEKGKAALRAAFMHGHRGLWKRNPTVDARTVLKAGRSILARVSRVGNKLVIKPVATAARKVGHAVKRATKRVANPDAKRGQYTVDVGSKHWFVMKGGLQAALKKGVREAGAGGHFYITNGVSAVTRHFKVNDRNKVQEIR